MPLTLRLSLLQWCQNSIFAAAMLTLGTYMLQVLDFSGREVGLKIGQQVNATRM